MSDAVFDPAIHATDKDGNPSLNRDGSFRKKRRDAGATRKATPRGKTSPTGGPRRRYEEGIQGLLQIPAMALSFVSPVDGYCVAMHTPPISKAVADLAIERPEVAAALDKILAVGPYGALIGAILPLAVQLAHNHGAIPESMARSMGATPKKDVERHLRLVATQERPEPETNTGPESENVAA